MTPKEIYELTKSLRPEDGSRLASYGKGLSKEKQRQLNNLVSYVRALRFIYSDDEVIQRVCTIILATAILVETE